MSFLPPRPSGRLLERDWNPVTVPGKGVARVVDKTPQSRLDAQCRRGRQLDDEVFSVDLDRALVVAVTMADVRELVLSEGARLNDETSRLRPADVDELDANSVLGELVDKSRYVFRQGRGERRRRRSTAQSPVTGRRGRPTAARPKPRASGPWCGQGSGRPGYPR